MTKDEIIHEIVVLIEEMSKDISHPDPIARIYSIQRDVNMAVGKRMREIKRRY